MFKFAQKFVSSPTLNNQRTYSYFTDNRYLEAFKQTENSLPLFYTHFGFPNLSLEEGFQKIDWFLENERYSPYLIAQCTPNWQKLQFPNASYPAFQLLTGPNCNDYISSLAIQPGLAKPLLNQVFWNPNMLNIYLGAIVEDEDTQHLFGPPNVGKSQNLAFLSLLIKAFLNEKYRVFLLHDPKAWNNENFAYQLLEELKLSFGEELMNKSHKDHSKAVEIFEEFDRLLNKANSEFKYQDYSVQQILSLIKKELLTDKKLIFLFDQVEAMTKQDESNKENPIKSIAIPLMNISNTSILVESITNKVIPSKTKIEEGKQFIFDLKMSEKNANEFMEQSCKEINEKLGQKLPQRSIRFALNHYTGYYPGYITDFVECFKETKNFDEALLKYQNQQVEEISKEFNTFIEQKVSKEGEDVREIILDNAYEISKQLQENRSLRTEFLNLDYVDLRYFSVEEDCLYPINMNVKKYYTDNYLLSDRELNMLFKKTNKLKQLEYEVSSQYKRLIIQSIIDDGEDIEVSLNGDYQKIDMNRIVASLSPEITMKDDQKNLVQIPDINSCPKIFDCVVLNEKEKKIFLLVIEKSVTDVLEWYYRYNIDDFQKYEDIVNEEGYKLYGVICYSRYQLSYIDEEFHRLDSLLTDEGFYKFNINNLKQFKNNPKSSCF